MLFILLRKEGYAQTYLSFLLQVKMKGLAISHSEAKNRVRN